MVDAVPTVMTVSELNAYVRSLIEEDFNLRCVFLTGEISNFTNHYRTGHLYMSIKDESCSVKAVMFRSAAQRLRFSPENGMSVIIRGRASVYERDGQFQIYIDDMQPDGLGAFSLAFEQMKNKLSKEGLFDAEHKKPIPKYPEKIGVVTSPTGAVIQDIKNVISRRFPCAEIILCPVEVQGVNAAGQIARAINKFSDLRAADVLIVGRGGGSLEDLWAFNEEAVARAVFNCEIPVISAVGHETDFTICDFAADLRAPTPSAAAELATPDVTEQKLYVNALINSISRSVHTNISDNRARLRLLCESAAMKSVHSFVEYRRLSLDDIMNRLKSSVSFSLSGSKARLSSACGKLDALSPLRVLSRGYCVAYKDEKALSSVKTLKENDEIKIIMSDGGADCIVRKCNYEKNNVRAGD